jgi:1A family penicillin-binding protein
MSLKKPWRKFLRSIHELLHTTNPVATGLFILAGLGFFFVGVSILWVAFSPIPDLDSLSTRKISESTKILDRTGQTVLYDLNPDVTRDIATLDEISPNIVNATIAVEDSDFYNHHGISFSGVARSIITDVTTGTFAQGGSTITQQVVKNTLLTNTKSVIRKLQEIILALRLEQKYSKQQILELYFNNTPYGGTLYGVEAATRAFFGKSAKDVDLAEAAYIAALPQSPTHYSPYGNNKDELDARKNYVLDRMAKLGMISEGEADDAKAEVVAFAPQENNSIIAPHFVFYIEQYLEDKYGPDAVTDGLTVTTTLDVDLQHSAESIVGPYALQNEKNFNASNAALVAIDPKTGQILAMVGSRNYFDKNIDGNYNIALAERQPGSSFKPFVYAAALEKGYTPQTAIFDLPTQFSTACAPSDITNDTPPCYAPENYDGKFRGPMTFTTALAQSINIPAVKTLYLAGINNVIDLATSMGITTLGNANQYGLSLALGAAEVRLLDLTSAYGVFADEGVRHPPTGILKVEDAHGKVLEEYQDEAEQVLDPAIAREMSSMLSNNEARFPEYPADNPFHFPGYDVAAKTGTTNDYRDAWTIGYTPNIAVGVWAGNNNNSPMVKEIAGYIVAPMWNQFMQVALEKYPKEYFGEPPAIPDTDPLPLRGIYTDGSERDAHELLYFVNKDNPLTPGNSQNDPQYPYWEYPLQAWVQAASQLSGQQTQSDTSANEDDESNNNRRKRDN